MTAHHGSGRCPSCGQRGIDWRLWQFRPQGRCAGYRRWRYRGIHGITDRQSDCEDSVSSDRDCDPWRQYTHDDCPVWRQSAWCERRHGRSPTSRSRRSITEPELPNSGGSGFLYLRSAQYRSLSVCFSVSVRFGFYARAGKTGFEGFYTLWNIKINFERNVENEKKRALSQNSEQQLWQQSWRAPALLHRRQQSPMQRSTQLVNVSWTLQVRFYGSPWGRCAEHRFLRFHRLCRMMRLKPHWQNTPFRVLSSPMQRSRTWPHTRTGSRRLQGDMVLYEMPDNAKTTQFLTALGLDASDAYRTDGGNLYCIRCSHRRSFRSAHDDWEPDKERSWEVRKRQRR